MAETPYTPTYESATDLIARGSLIDDAVTFFGLDNHPASETQKVTRWIAQVEWNRAHLIPMLVDSQWLALAGTVERLERALDRQ